MTKADLAQMALSQVGTWCYVWGGNGQDMTAMTDAAREKWICRREEEEENRERVRKLYAKLVKQGVALIRGGDCSGFVFWCMHELGVWDKDRNANGMYGASIKKTREQIEPGDLAFRLTDGKATHVGVYVGDGKFVHSKGRDVGVVHEESSKSYWQAYGAIKELQPEPEPDPPVPPEPKKQYVLFKGSVYLRREPMVTGKILKTMHKGDKLPLVGRDYWDARGNEWYAVEYECEDTVGAFCSAYTLKKKKYTEIIGE